MDCHGASKKKATEEDVRKMAKGLTLDHDKVAGAGSLLDAAQNFRSGSGMEGLTSILGDVQALLPESDAEDGPDQEGEEAAEEGEDEEGKDQEELVTKKQKWFDRDRAVSKANKMLVATYDKMFKTSTTELDKMEKMLKDYDGLTPSERKQLEGDVTILRSRLACLQAVHGTDDALKRLIAEVERASEKTAASPPSSASSTADPMRGLGRAPPCGSYKKLRTMQAWRNHADSVLECQTLAEIEKVKSDAADYKNPIADLVAASKTASSDVSKGLKALQAARKLQQEKEPSGKSARKKASAALSGPPVFDLAEHCKPITVLAENEPIPDLSYPALIQTSSEKQAKFDQTECVGKTIYEGFVELFNTMAPTQKVDRAHKKWPLDSDVQNAMQSRVEAVLPQARIEESWPHDLKDPLRAQAVIVAKNSWKVACEKHHLGPDYGKLEQFNNSSRNRKS